MYRALHFRYFALECNNSSVDITDAQVGRHYYVLNECISKSDIIEKFNIKHDNLTKDELHELIDYMSAIEFINRYGITNNRLRNIEKIIRDDVYFTRATNYFSKSNIEIIDIQKQIEIHNFINRLLISNYNAIDKQHYQIHVYNFSKFYSQLNGLDYTVEFYYEDSETGATCGNGRVRFNTKYLHDIVTDYGNLQNKHFDTLINIFHEFFHAMQHQATTDHGTVNKYTLEQSLDRILREIDEKYFKNNYWDITTEIDARYNSFILASNYLKEIAPDAYEELQKSLEELQKKELERFH